MNNSFKQYKVYDTIVLKMTPLLVRQLHKIGTLKLIPLNEDRVNGFAQCIIELDWLSKTQDIGNPSATIENILAPLALFGDYQYSKPEIHSINNAGRKIPDEVRAIFAGPIKLDIGTINPNFDSLSVKLNKIKKGNPKAHKILIKALKLVNAAKMIGEFEINVAYALLVSVVESLTVFLESKPKFVLEDTLSNDLMQALDEKLSQEDIDKLKKQLKGMLRKLSERFVNIILENIPKDYNSQHSTSKKEAIDLKDIPTLTKHLKAIYGARSKFLHAGIEFPREATLRIIGVFKQKMTPAGFGIPLSDKDIYDEHEKAHKQQYASQCENDIPSFSWFKDIVTIVLISIIDKQANVDA